ncbi:MAG: P-type conjugative transfer protein TrbJ [Pseudoxanthomonas sp.]
MKKTLLSLCIGLALCAGSAQAQMAVFDPANFQQNLLTAARTLEQINNQVRQLQNEAQMLVNQGRNLTGLNFSALRELRVALEDSRRLLDEAKGLSFDIEQARSTYARLYPDGYGVGTSAGDMARDAQERWQQAREALRTAVEFQAQVVGQVAGDETTLSDLIDRSQSAVGALQAAQATNQLLALQSKQLLQGQQLQAAQGRAVALEQARTAAIEAQSREARRRFMTDKPAYTGEPVRLFGGDR